MNRRERSEKADAAILRMELGMGKIRAILEGMERRRMQAEMEVSADSELPSSELQKRPADKVREHEVQLHRFNISYPGDKVIASTVEKIQHQVDALQQAMKHSSDALAEMGAKQEGTLDGAVGATQRLQHQITALRDEFDSHLCTVIDDDNDEEKRFEALETAMAEMKNTVENLQNHRTWARDNIRHLGRRLDELHRTVVDMDHKDRFKELEGRVNALDETLTNIQSGWLSSSSPPMSSKVAKEFEDRIAKIEERLDNIATPSITAFGRPIHSPHVEHRLEERKPILPPDYHSRIKDLEDSLQSTKQSVDWLVGKEIGAHA